MLLIALSDKEPPVGEWFKLKQEMSRLAFVGDSAIILAQILNMVIDPNNQNLNEKDLDSIKNKSINLANL